MQITTTLKKYTLALVDYIPYKLQILLTALYIWTWIFFKINKLTGFILGSIITYMPTYFLLDIKPKLPIRILKASDDKSNDITKRLNLFMKYKWDVTSCDDQGCVDLDSFADYIGTSIIYIMYVFDYDLDLSKLDKFLELAEDSNDINNTSVFKKYINIAIIDFSKKIIHKIKEGKLESEDILFGEINLH